MLKEFVAAKMIGNPTWPAKATSVSFYLAAAERLAVSKLDEASSITAAGLLHMMHTMKRILRVVGDSNSTSLILCHLPFYVQLKFVDLKILS